MTHGRAKGIFVGVAAVSAVLFLALTAEAMTGLPEGTHEAAGRVSEVKTASASSGESEAVMQGKKVYEKWSCSACHKINGAGGGVGPDLTHVGSKRSEAWLKEQVVEPSAHFAESAMPAFAQMPEKELDLLGQYLSSLK